MSNLAVRIAVAIVAIPLIVFFSMSGGFYFFGMIALIALLGVYELYGMAKEKGIAPQVVLGLMFGLFVVSAFIARRVHEAIQPFISWQEMLWPMTPQVVLVLFLIFVPLLMIVELFRNKGSAIINTGTTLLAVLYVSLFLGSIVGLRELFAGPDFPFGDFFGESRSAEISNQVDGWGGATIVTVFVSIWMCDSLAYFAGRFFGRNKLFERVSPNKTWEGASAGYVGAVATFLISQYYFLPYLTIGSAFVCGSIVGIFGQLGDLAESLLKRDAGLKDSSSLIPGHGGVLDRFDSLIFVSPVMFLYLNYILFW